MLKKFAIRARAVNRRGLTVFVRHEVTATSTKEAAAEFRRLVTENGFSYINIFSITEVFHV
ncbi:hypothetical protein FWP04_14220 [Salmonella enterica subsp. enterica serovar Mountpleasant]|nr:hypothetical protein [Salmonella enterica subsp. enterica serovar Mountpleasant]